VRTEPSTRRVAAELLGALALVAVVLFGALFFVGYGLGRAADDVGDPFVPGPAPSRAQRQAVERADCKQLVQLKYQYIPNGDSVDPEMTLLAATNERIASLHCALPSDLRPR